MRLDGCISIQLARSVTNLSSAASRGGSGTETDRTPRAMALAISTGVDHQTIGTLVSNKMAAESEPV